jgi:hypothetical protein
MTGKSIASIFLLIAVIVVGYFIFKPKPKTTDTPKQKLDANGKPILDAQGKPLYEPTTDAPTTAPVKDAPVDTCYRKFKRDSNDKSFELDPTLINLFVDDARRKGFAANLIFSCLAFFKGMDLQVNLSNAEKYRKDIDKFKIYADIPDIANTVERTRAMEYSPGDLVCESTIKSLTRRFLF